VIDVTDGPDVDVRLLALELDFRHRDVSLTFLVLLLR
jgi:hypothetical protein